MELPQAAFAQRRVLAQPLSSKARRAAAMARSASSFVPSATLPITSSVAGFTLSKRDPFDASQSSPSISARVSGWRSGRLMSVQSFRLA